MSENSKKQISCPSCCSNGERKLNSKNDKSKLITRMKRIEGQVKGIQQMLEDERYCVDILTQISAVRSALGAVGNILLENHIRGCVVESVERDASDKDDMIEELVSLINKYSK